MFSTKPFNTLSSKDLQLPTCMYVLDSLCLNSHLPENNTVGDKMDYHTLEKSQNDLIARLETLKKQISNFSPAPLKKITATSSNGCVLDIAISFHPNHVPASVISATKFLSSKQRVHAQCLLHSSLRHKCKVPQELLPIHSSLFHGRGEQKYVVTFVLKDVEFPTMMVNATKQIAIQGEANISRYLFSLACLDTSPNGKTLVTNDNAEDLAIKEAMVDSWLELARPYLTSTSAKKSGDDLVAKVAPRLANNSWLVGNECTAADLVVHSVVVQKCAQLGPGVQQWANAINCINQLSFT